MDEGASIQTTSGSGISVEIGRSNGLRDQRSSGIEGGKGRGEDDLYRCFLCSCNDIMNEVQSRMIQGEKWNEG